MRNAGLLFYKEYFKNLSFIEEAGKIKPVLEENKTKECIQQLFNSKLEKDTVTKISSVNADFELITIYPGLLIGSGYNHEIGEQENELKLGFFFDYTTGLPCIPGSSVKGVLRDACEKVNGDYVKSIIKELADGERKPEKSEVKEEAKKLSNGDLDKSFDKGKNSVFIAQVFAGKKDKDNYIAQKDRDIFFDAFPIESKNDNGKFLANDYITPHKDQFKDPKPIQFLKVLPQVIFQFNFRLTDTCINKAVKKELFRQILLDLGVGAKTNVGYGQFK